jgi:hypothetical protein
VTPRESNQRPSDFERTTSTNSVINSNGVWTLHTTYSQYLHYLGTSGHFMFRSVVLGQRNTVPVFSGWVGHSGDGNSYREIIGGGLRTGEACCTANIMLKIGHGLLQKW